ncbi:alkene reductase [Acidisoma cellulosilytica]|uniref:Alkene reductase n=1 Tax=Acidisoma cellulosilyticum TaxID=2802395 RepID=A0A963Z747_9PROT|nr:alkene reductase [Acidisoma cellulosilyticum]MCB8883813.1 alkene reductase [Acidisoma cellulosilyticum]
MATLLSPIQIGAFELSHRVVLAPLTRMRSRTPGNIPGPMMVDYYAKRATLGGLLISEATFITRQGNGGYGSPGIENDEQVAGWRKVTDAVHAKGAKILLQLWHVGRVSHSDLQPGGGSPITPSKSDLTLNALLENGPGPVTPARAIATEEIPTIVGQYAQAAVRARTAGFDGVEIHAANGYLIDQFLQDGSNERADAYGGSIENRARFLFDVVDAVAAYWGPGRTGVRLGPSGSFNGMHDSNPEALFSYVARGLKARGVGYLHIIEPRIVGNTEKGDQTAVAAAALKFHFGGPIIAAGGFDQASAEAIIEGGDADLVAFGRHFIANPDLVRRFRDGLPLNPYDRTTFYYGGSKGYTDYPLYEEVAA